MRSPRSLALGSLLLLPAAALLTACSQGNVFTLEVGDCYDDPSADSQEVSSVPIVECDEPHDNEVFHVITLDDGDFPGREALEESATACVAAFESYVGASLEETELMWYPLQPTEGSWGGGDRDVVCSLYSADLEKLEGSMEGTAG